MKRWHGSCIGVLLVLLIGGGSLLFFVPVGGAMLVGMPPIFDKFTGWAVCPGAVSIQKEEFNSGPVTTSPSGMTGHQEEWTCAFEDGSQKVVPNKEIALKGDSEHPSPPLGFAEGCGVDPDDPCSHPRRAIGETRNRLKPELCSLK